jgi:uncharacterized protein YukE
MGGMGVDVRMDYGMMEAMSAAYRQAQNDLGDVITQMTNVQQKLQDGAMQGDAGDHLSNSAIPVLISKIQELADKMGELSGDIDDAMKAMREGVASAQGRFSH